MLVLHEFDIFLMTASEWSDHSDSMLVVNRFGCIPFDSSIRYWRKPSLRKDLMSWDSQGLQHCAGKAINYYNTVFRLIKLFRAVKIYWEDTMSIACEVFLALVNCLDVFLLFLWGFLLEKNLLHIPAPFGSLTGRFVTLFLLLSLLSELQFLSLLLLPNLVFTFLVLLNLLLHLSNQLRMQLLLSLNCRSKSLYFVLDFLYTL